MTEKINEIIIENIKGFGDGNNKCNFKPLNTPIYPNMPNIIVAPNGFGKSSLAVAFQSMNSAKIVLDKKNYHNGDENKTPCIKINYIEGVTEKIAEANKDSNSIANIFDIYVINSRIKPKAKTMNTGKFSMSTATLTIEPITLINLIPARILTQYSITEQKNKFGKNGKILPNLNELCANYFKFWSSVDTSDIEKCFNAQKYSDKINNLVEYAKNQKGNTKKIKDLILKGYLSTLQSIKPLKRIADLIGVSMPNFAEVDKYLGAIQIVFYYKDHTKNFKDTIKYKKYEDEKNHYSQTLNDFGLDKLSSVKLSESKSGLILKFPDNHKISNGERDTLVLIAMLMEAKRKLKKNDCILIIDEVFDYMDDSNLMAAQYFITNFIKEFKGKGKKLYVLILTHLDPKYFKNFAFNNMKIYYPNQNKPDKITDVGNIVKNRNAIDELCTDNGKQKLLSKHFLHFDPEPCDIKQEFEKLKSNSNNSNILLNTNLGDSQIFLNFIKGEVDKFKNNKKYCPFSICVALRIQIEKEIYNKLDEETKKSEFLEKHGTNDKLDFASGKGIEIDEKFRMLSIIYNDTIHFNKNAYSNYNPLLNKLQHPIIKDLAKKVLESF